MPSEGPRDYDIGYKKPPLASRFKKGNNANPKGRPRGSKALAAVLKQALDEPAQDDNGRRRRQTKREQVIRRLVEKSAGADLAATKLLFELLHKADPNAVAADPADAAPLSQDALELLKQKLARLAHGQAAIPAPGPDDAAATDPDSPDPIPAAAVEPSTDATAPTGVPRPTNPNIVE
jgi:Family of unknown function (DUF5681)